MATEVIKTEQAEAQGIKLFGKTIALQVKVEETTKSANNKNSGNTSTSSHEVKFEASGNLDDDDNNKRPDKIIACPRCKSMDTKFCYFNNYNVKQPRHFCKGCQRYWTAGGALRNVPVGAGRRKARPGPPHPSLFDAAGVDQYLVDGAVFQEYYWAHHPRQHLMTPAKGRYGGGFRPYFPAKRRKIYVPTGQTNS